MPRRITYQESRPAKPMPVAPRTPTQDRSAEKRERNTFYAGVRWRRLRLAFLRKNPLCARCRARGLVVPADTVHHRIERLEDPRMAYKWANLEGLCASCHTRHHNDERARRDAPE